MKGLDLLKPEKKQARQIIEKGLQREYANGLGKAANIIHQWELEQLDNREAYLKLYRQLEKHDKHIGKRYDIMTGSKYLYIIAGQLADKIIEIEDIEGFREEIKDAILLLSGLND